MARTPELTTPPRNPKRLADKIRKSSNHRRDERAQNRREADLVRRGGEIDFAVISGVLLELIQLRYQLKLVVFAFARPYRLRVVGA